MKTENIDLNTLETLSLTELRELAKELNIEKASTMRKKEIIDAIKAISPTPAAEPQTKKQDNDETVKNIHAEGILEILPDGFGFLRAQNCYNSDKDVYVSSAFIRRAGMRPGDKIKGLAQLLHVTEKHPSLYQIDTINDRSYEFSKRRPRFSTLVPVHPNERIKLEHEDEDGDVSSRLIDLVAPIGKGQRGLIVSPPKAGKTTILKQIANGISANHPEVKLIVLLIDERPEEVTDIQRSTNATVIYSTFDEHPEHHTKIAETVLEHSKRLVESGDDVVILLDSITRLARSYNLTEPPSGRTLSGGLDPAALFQPKGFFGAARNIENGGSLTIIATALVDTGSRMDDVIYEEFKGTGNMELHLDRRLAEKRIYPAVDIYKSGTRRDELLLTKKESDAMATLRRSLADGKGDRLTQSVLETLMTTKSNDQFVKVINHVLAQNDKNISGEA